MDGRITARVPERLPEKEIRSLIEENKVKLYKRYKEFLPETSDQVNNLSGKYPLVNNNTGYETIYYDGAALPFVLGDIRLKFIKGKIMDHVSLRYNKNVDGSRTLTIETLSEDMELVRGCIADWYRNYAKVTLQKKAAFYSKKMGTDFGRITVREQKTRWGSCSSKGNLNFNWKLMMMPEPVIDYVVIHEIAHRKHMDHSRNFWKEVENILPDYKEKRDWLKINGRIYNKY